MVFTKNFSSWAYWLQSKKNISGYPSLIRNYQISSIPIKDYSGHWLLVLFMVSFITSVQVRGSVNLPSHSSSCMLSADMFGSSLMHLWLLGHLFKKPLNRVVFWFNLCFQYGKIKFRWYLSSGWKSSPRKGNWTKFEDWFHQVHTNIALGWR